MGPARAVSPLKLDIRDMNTKRDVGVTSDGMLMATFPGVQVVILIIEQS